MTKFDAKAVAEQLKTQHAAKRQTRVRRSRLDAHADDLAGLIREGCSAVHLQAYLRHKRVTVAISTVYRWAEKHQYRFL